MFSVGEKVQCIDGSWGSATGSIFQKVHCPNLPKVGNIYTIRSTEFITAEINVGPVWFVRLREIVNPHGERGNEPIFFARQFVPLLTRRNLESVYRLLDEPIRSFAKPTREEREFFRKKKKVGV